METPGHPGADNLPRALAWMIFSGFSFALRGAAVKLADAVPLPAKVFFRNLVTLLITSGIALRERTNPLAARGHRWRLFWRACRGLGGVTLYFLALEHLNLADASLPALAGLGSGLFAGLACTIVRSLKGKAEPNRIIFTFSLVSTLATAPFLLLAFPRPDTVQWPALIGCGLSAAGGQFGLTFAYHHAPASRVAIFTYLHVLFALVLGLIFWGEMPDLLSWLGGLLIVAAAVSVHKIGLEPRRRTVP